MITSSYIDNMRLLHVATAKKKLHMPPTRTSLPRDWPSCRIRSLAIMPSHQWRRPRGGRCSPPQWDKRMYSPCSARFLWNEHHASAHLAQGIGLWTQNDGVPCRPLIAGVLRIFTFKNSMDLFFFASKKWYFWTICFPLPVASSQNSKPCGFVFIGPTRSRQTWCLASIR